MMLNILFAVIQWNADFLNLQEIRKWVREIEDKNVVFG